MKSIVERATLMSAKLSGIADQWSPIQPGQPSVSHWRAFLAKGQFFEFDPATSQAVFAIVDDMLQQWVDVKLDPTEPLSFPVAAVPPARICFLALDQTDDDAIAGILAQDDGSLDCFFMSQDSIPVFGGTFQPGGDGIAPDGSSDDQFNFTVEFLSTVAVCFSLINEPRFVARFSTGNRHEKKRASRGYGLAVDCWHKIGWKVDEPTTAKAVAGDDLRKLPYHFRRAYWRKAESHWVNVSLLPASDVTGRAAGFYQRIAEDWVGNPRFGIKRSIYAPRLSAGFGLKGR